MLGTRKHNFLFSLPCIGCDIVHCNAVRLLFLVGNVLTCQQITVYVCLNLANDAYSFMKTVSRQKANSGTVFIYMYVITLYMCYLLLCYGCFVFLYV